MKFSLLIANYNNGKFFKACYDSIISQTYTNWEAIIVDDGSTDNSVEIIDCIIENDSRFILYINNKNYGCGYTKHKCVTLATGTLCSFIDPDDALTNDAVYKMAEAFGRQKNIVLAHSNFIFCDEQLQPVGKNSHAKAVENLNHFFNLAYEVTHFTAFSRIAYLNTDGIDPYMQRAVDQDLYLKMAETGDFYFVNAYLYLYRKHAKGISSSGAEQSNFWHWYAIIQSAKRRNINIEELFVKTYISRNKCNNMLAGKNGQNLRLNKLLMKLMGFIKSS